MRDLNTYLRDRFGTKVYKLALDGGMTCPNRDGICGTRGCIFCSEGGSGDFAEQSEMTPAKFAVLRRAALPRQDKTTDNICMGVGRQIAAAKERLRTKLGRQFDSTKYIAYFQSYTNTYAPVEYLRALFTEAISDESVVVLSVATRPDCLPEEVVELLAELNKIKPVWVELGLQTIHEESAKFIRRGYELSVFDDAVARLEAAGIEVIVHVILGLPGETREDMLETVKYVTLKAAEPEKFAASRDATEENPEGLATSCDATEENPEGFVASRDAEGAGYARRPGLRGIKLQLLHIMRGTDLGAMFDASSETIKTTGNACKDNLADGEAELLLAIHTPEEYIDILDDALSIIGDRLVIHRLTGDAPHDKLIFPMWSANKRLILNHLKNI